MAIDGIEIIKYKPHKKEKKNFFDLKIFLFIQIGILANILSMYILQFLPWYEEKIFIDISFLIIALFYGILFFLCTLSIFIKNKK